ncbi:MAG: hypothetical protein A3G75_14955 [Verrucomicrobia bacterium RIFCSPLOWO2_12_FULL_64_8]|nr:MAG: hypothetical protein A3G75_14955 [Verrucomicrobia bacterium RIFCSPLOWO2_12_FULL_64_8]
MRNADCEIRGANSPLIAGLRLRHTAWAYPSASMLTGKMPVPPGKGCLPAGVPRLRDEGAVPAHEHKLRHAHSALRTPRSAFGFTMLEILLVLALIAMLTSVMVVGGRRMFAEETPTPEEVFWQACRSAQELAAISDRDVTLRFDEKEKKLLWTNGTSGGEAAFATTGREVGLQFLPASKNSSSLILLGGQAVEVGEGLPRVKFYPDGTCTAFRALFRIGAASRSIAIDPWTCAPVLEKKEAQ